MEDQPTGGGRAGGSPRPSSATGDSRRVLPHSITELARIRRALRQRAAEEHRKGDDDAPTVMIPLRPATSRGGKAEDGTEDAPTVRISFEGTRKDGSGDPDPADAATDSPQEEQPESGTRARSDRIRRVALVTGRSLLAMVSVVALVVTGFAWSTLDRLNSSINTTDVLVDIPKPSVETETETETDGAIDILLVGSDSRTDAEGNPLPESVLKLLRTESTTGLNTDTIIVMRIAEDGSGAHAISIPRDTYVSIPGYQDDKINAAYGVTKSRRARELRDQGVTDRKQIEQESAQAGRRVLVQVVQDLLGLQIDHYAEVNLYGFYLLTEAVGGVEVCLKRATSDPDSGANFRAGRQTITRGDALAFVRQRKNLPRSDLDRIVRQQVFMAAVVNKVLSTGTLTDPQKLNGLMEAARKSLVLDAGWDVLTFAQQMQGLAAGNVEFYTLPVEEVGARNERGQSIITVDKEKVRRFAADVLRGRAGGETPTTDGTGTASAPTSTPSDASGGSEQNPTDRWGTGPGLWLDGAAPLVPLPQQTEQEPITADGVPCVY
ncbi:MAG TPA: LCP family protein [Pseudonocardiaceae bacterium]